MFNYGKLVQVTTEDELFLPGFYTHNSESTILIHIHGFEGNFYENKFVQVLSDHLNNSSISFLSINTRGCEKIKNFNTIKGEIRTIGARYELLEESPKDVDAWVKFAVDKSYKNIVLSGHSLGTYKAIRYLREGKYAHQIKKLLLLSPFDKKGAMKKYTNIPIEDLLIKAKEKIDNGYGDEMISKEFDDIEVSYKTYISWYKQDDLGRCFEFCSPDYNFPALQEIKIPTKVVVGSKDEYFHLSDPKHPEKALELMKKYISDCETTLIENANHGYDNCEKTLAEEVSKFIMK